MNLSINEGITFAFMAAQNKSKTFLPRYKEAFHFAHLPDWKQGLGLRQEDAMKFAQATVEDPSRSYFARYKEAYQFARDQLNLQKETAIDFAFQAAASGSKKFLGAIRAASCQSVLSSSAR